MRFTDKGQWPCQHESGTTAGKKPSPAWAVSGATKELKRPSWVCPRAAGPARAASKPGSPDISHFPRRATTLSVADQLGSSGHRQGGTSPGVAALTIIPTKGQQPEANSLQCFGFPDSRAACESWQIADQLRCRLKGFVQHMRSAFHAASGKQRVRPESRRQFLVAYEQPAASFPFWRFLSLLALLPRHCVAAPRR